MARKHHFIDPGRQSFPAKKKKHPGFAEADRQRAQALSRAKLARSKAKPKSPPGSGESVLFGSRGAVSARTKAGILQIEEDEKRDKRKRK